MSIWIATQPIDFRRGIDSLATLVSEAFGANPYDGGLYAPKPLSRRYLSLAEREDRF
ncbi:IS66 family insertion sequence element accessory protein TnpB [Bradyrhizobium sp. 18]|nr:IS66 family insertion sequence element accessory protein TnpB [Bradyrhizobium sp. 18]